MVQCYLYITVDCRRLDCVRSSKYKIAGEYNSVVKLKRNSSELLCWRWIKLDLLTKTRAILQEGLMRPHLWRRSTGGRAFHCVAASKESLRTPCAQECQRASDPNEYRQWVSVVSPQQPLSTCELDFGHYQLPDRCRNRYLTRCQGCPMFPNVYAPRRQGPNEYTPQARGGVHSGP
jgi:hypothetical protein